MTFREIAYVVIDVALGDAIEPDTIKRIVDRSLCDTRPFSPEAEAAFVASLWLETDKDKEQNTLVCAIEPEDQHLVNALAGKTALHILMPKGCAHARNDAQVIEIQGSATDCLHLCSELERVAPVCTLHNAAANAVRVAVAIYCATHPPMDPSAEVIVNSAAMHHAYETARKLGLNCKSPELASALDDNNEIAPLRQDSHHREQRRPKRVAPTVEAVMRELNNNKTNQTVNR